ncbi:MAG: type II secretion system protein N [Gemmatimonadota bacterium]
MSPLLLRLAVGAAGLFFAAGVSLRLIPPLPPSVSVAPVVDTVAPPVSDARDSVVVSSYDAIIDKSIFSPSRAAPAERFVPLNGAMDEGAQAPAVRAPSRQEGPLQRLRLVGVAVGPMGGVAIIDTNPSTPGADVFRVGDRIGRARVVEIREDAVVLETPGGRMVLKLPPSVRRSP